MKTVYIKRYNFIAPVNMVSRGVKWASLTFAKLRYFRPNRGFFDQASIATKAPRQRAIKKRSKPKNTLKVKSPQRALTVDGTV